ncbi:hypothetical protein [Clostridium sp. BJN0013]
MFLTAYCRVISIFKRKAYILLIILGDIKIHGLIMDPETGKLEVIANEY